VCSNTQARIVKGSRNGGTSSRAQVDAVPEASVREAQGRAHVGSGQAQPAAEAEARAEAEEQTDLKQNACGQPSTNACEEEKERRYALYKRLGAGGLGLAAGVQESASRATEGAQSQPTAWVQERWQSTPRAFVSQSVLSLPLLRPTYSVPLLRHYSALCQGTMRES
jgi:hypothetical protein